MAQLSKYTYLFAICTCFSFLDAWNIGANDVANSFSTSVSSRSLTMKQAMAIAAVMELSGSLAVGSRVTDTIRLKIVDPKLYEQEPSVLLLAMACTIIASAIFLTFATRQGLPVSTTHSLVGGLVGAATASVGITKVDWSINALFLFTKYFILTKHNAPRKAFYSIPVYTFLTVGLLTMLLSWKGVQTRVDLTTEQVIMAVFITGGGATALEVFFVLPFIWRKIMMEDWQLRWWEAWQGPWLLKRPPPPPAPPHISRGNVKNYYRGHLTRDELNQIRRSETLMQSVQNSPNLPSTLDKDDNNDEIQILPPPAIVSQSPHRPPGPWYTVHVLIWYVNRVLLRGLEKDVVMMQKRNAVLSWNLDDMHARAAHYDNRAEYMYSALQILTAATASFIHGANDVSNSIGPFTSAYHVWSTGEIPSQVGVPLWILAMGGCGIVIGLLTYGYHVMRNMGNRLTLISPSRGFCMELASAMTILIATRLSLPVSTTQCIAGALVGVGLANGDWRCINLRLVAWIYGGWIITLPCTAFMSGSLMSLIINAPRWDNN
uniref:Phosphate transporter n=1 Tax=Bionectria ochroleuca TaxID=29856 RepID=A0A0B7KCG6_BIOOC